MHKRPLAVISIFFILGIVLARFRPDSVKFIHISIVTLIFILSAFIFSRTDSRFRGNDKEIRNDKEEAPQSFRAGRIANILLLLSVALFAALLYVNSNVFPANHISHVLGEDNLKTDIVGVVKSPALIRKPYYGKINSTYLFEVEQIGDKSVRGLSQVRIQTEKDYQYGDRLLVKASIKKPHLSTYVQGEALNKKGFALNFNYREYLERQNIFALINTKENNITVLSQDYKSNPILKYAYSLREKLKNQIIKKMPLESGAFMRAILLGDRSELPKDIQENFKNSGTMHILAISGLHIGLIALVVITFLRSLRIGRETAYILTIIFLVFFALLTLSRPSVVRAVVMACIFLTGMLLGRKVDVYNSLGAAALFVLVRNPRDIFNVGFQLSFIAVTFIVFLTPKFMGLVKEGTNYYVKKYLYAPLAVSVSAWLGTFSLILYYFRIITPVAILSNIFIIPALFVLLVGGLCFLALGWLPFVGGFLASFNHVFCQLIFSFTDFFASLKLGHFHF